MSANSNLEERPRGVSMELLLLFYLMSYIPYAMLTRLLATIPAPALGRPLSGLEEVPAIILLSAVPTYLFIWLSGWWRHAHHAAVLGTRIPRPTRWTVLSGAGAALLLLTVPLSFTFRGVSIPFMQLILRGDVLIIAPLVDLMAGRRVRWYSWGALVLVALGLALTIHARRGLHLPLLAGITVVLYTLGYLVRLVAMTRIAKSGDASASKGYFVEEQLVAIPLTLGVLALLSISHAGEQGAQLAFAFTGIWSSGQLSYLAILGGLQFLIAIFSVMILLDRRENTFCVAFERSASVLAGLAAAFLLAAMSFGSPPADAEIGGAVLLMMAITLLSLAPRLTAR